MRVRFGFYEILLSVSLPLTVVTTRHPELMYTIAAILVVVYIGTLEVGIPELNDFKNR